MVYVTFFSGAKFHFHLRQNAASPCGMGPTETHQFCPLHEASIILIKAVNEVADAVEHSRLSSYAKRQTAPYHTAEAERLRQQAWEIVAYITDHAAIFTHPDYSEVRRG